jgi:DNA-binding transcriptional MerR regulator
MTKKEGAFLTIGELAEELNLAQHILRYWETRFPQLRPLQRAGNRRYYRPADVQLAKKIHHLLYVEGFTVRGAQQVLSPKKGGKQAVEEQSAAPLPDRSLVASSGDTSALIDRLETIRERLTSLLDDQAQ